MKNYKLSQGASVVLDLIRGASAQFVVIGHGISFFGIFHFLQPPNFPWMQKIAVLIFFLLSGFLITYSTVRKRLNSAGYGFKHFFIDRFARIYVAFIPALVFVVILDALSRYLNPETYSYSEAFDLVTFIGNLFMLQDHVVFSLTPEMNVTSFGSARPFWTLAIEWWIYLFFGYLVLVFAKQKNLSLVSVGIVSLLSIVPLFNLVSGRGGGLSAYWIFGAMIYLISTQGILQQVAVRTKVLTSLVLAALACLRIAYTGQEYEPIFALILALMLLIIIDIFDQVRIPKSIVKFIRVQASFSYTLYLIHYSILDFFKAHFHEASNPYLLFAAGFVVANLISLAIGRFTEVVLTERVKRSLYGYVRNRERQKRAIRESRHREEQDPVHPRVPVRSEDPGHPETGGTAGGLDDSAGIRPARMRLRVEDAARDSDRP